MARRRKMRLSVLVMMVFASSAFAADRAPRMEAVVASVEGETLVCRLFSRGLPGDRLLQSMRSGLVSAFDLRLTLFDGDGRTVHQQSVSFRLAFDLWEEVFSVGTAGHDRTFAAREDLQRFLNDLPAVPVGRVSLLRAEADYRLRVGLILHAIAPSERGRVAAVIAGSPTHNTSGEDSQEATVSLGALIRFVYRDDAGSDVDSEIYSSWFRREELLNATD